MVRVGAPRLFVDRPGTRRVRRAGDVLLLVVAVIGPAVLGVLALPLSGFELALVRVLAAIPDVLDEIWRLTIWLALLWSGTLLVAVVVRRRWALLRDLAIATGAGVLLALAIARLVDGEWELTWDLAPQGGDLAHGRHGCGSLRP